MRRVAEIIHVVPEEREEYLKTHLNPSKRSLRSCGFTESAIRYTSR